MRPLCRHSILAGGRSNGSKNLIDKRGPESGRREKPDEAILIEAERRLDTEEYGTALVLARNVRFLFWYEDWRAGRNYIRRTADILEKAYAGLGWKRAAANVRNVTEVGGEGGSLNAPKRLINRRWWRADRSRIAAPRGPSHEAERG